MASYKSRQRWTVGSQRANAYQRWNHSQLLTDRASFLLTHCRVPGGTKVEHQVSNRTMKRTAKGGLAIGVCIALAAVFVWSPGIASANSIPTTGSGLDILSCIRTPPITEQHFPASTAFFTLAGWASSLPWTSPGLSPAERAGIMSPDTFFVLFVDGNKVPSTPDIFFLSDGTLVKANLTNFPGGMTGTHIFVGRLYIDASLAGGTFGTAVLVVDCHLTVHFV